MQIFAIDFLRFYLTRMLLPADDSWQMRCLQKGQEGPVWDRYSPCQVNTLDQRAFRALKLTFSTCIAAPSFIR